MRSACHVSISTNDRFSVCMARHPCTLYKIRIPVPSSHNVSNTQVPQNKTQATISIIYIVICYIHFVSLYHCNITCKESIKFVSDITALSVSQFSLPVFQWKKIVTIRTRPPPVSLDTFHRCLAFFVTVLQWSVLLEDNLQSLTYERLHVRHLCHSIYTPLT